MSNADVRLEYNLNAGTTAFLLAEFPKKYPPFTAGVGLSSGYVTGNNFSNRTWSVVSSNEVAVTVPQPPGCRT